MDLFKKATLLYVCVCCAVVFVIPVKNEKKKYLKEIIEKHDTLFFLLILIIGAFVRFYKLSALPVGFHVDEAAMAYDAYALANYGVDRYLNPYPVYLINYGGGQSALMAYMVGLCYKVFGNTSVFAVRFPTAFMGTLSIAAVYMLVKKLYGKVPAVCSAFCMAIFPSCIKMSRFGLDCYLLYSFAAVAFLALAYAVEKKKIWLFTLSGVLFGATLYTYAISYIFIPVFLAVTLLYLLLRRKINLTQLIAMGIPVFIFALPLMLMIAINSGFIAPVETGFITIPVLPDYRGSEVSVTNISGFMDSLKNLLIWDGWLYNSDPVFNTTYIAALPLILSGLAAFLSDFIKGIKEKESDNKIIILGYIAASFVLLCVVSGPCVNKLNVIYPLLAILGGIGISAVLNKSDILAFSITGVLAVYFMFFAADYFDAVNLEKELPLFSGNMAPAIELAEEISQDNTVFICDNMMDVRYEALALALQASPYDYASNKEAQQIGRYKLEIPLYFDREGTLVEQLYPDCIYIIRKTNENETYAYIEDRLTAYNFEKQSTDYYNVYYCTQ